MAAIYNEMKNEECICRWLTVDGRLENPALELKIELKMQHKILVTNIVKMK
jgi:hypothetical protein